MRALVNKQTLEVLGFFDSPYEVPAQIDMSLEYVEVPNDDTEAFEQEYAWKRLRKIRNEFLTLTDFTQISDCSFTTDQKEAWASYRQALRDLPQNTTDPLNVSWITPPSSPTIEAVNELLEKITS